MGTHCRIAVINDDESVDSIYCHYDGYIEFVGKCLVDNYDEVKIMSVLELGDICSIGDSPDDCVVLKEGNHNIYKSANIKEFIEFCIDCKDIEYAYVLIANSVYVAYRDNNWTFRDVRSLLG